MMELLSSAQVEQFLEAKLADREIAGLIQQFALPYRELMAYYRCAMMEVSEKFRCLCNTTAIRSKPSKRG